MPGHYKKILPAQQPIRARLLLQLYDKLWLLQWLIKITQNGVNKNKTRNKRLPRRITSIVGIVSKETGAAVGGKLKHKKLDKSNELNE